MNPYNRANFRGDQSKGARSPNRWNITNLWLSVPSLSFPFLPFFLVVAYSKNGWTDIHDLYMKRRGFTQGCAFWGFRWQKNIGQGIKTPKNTPKVGVVRQFQAKCKKNWNCYIFNRVNQINTKFEETLETINSRSWVVLKPTNKIQDGGSRHFENSS